MSKQAIVFGGSGFLGSHVADVLSGCGSDVTIFDVRESPYLQPGQKMVKGDIQDYDQVLEAVKGKEVVFHFAGLADLDSATAQPLETVTKNIMGTVNLLEAATKAGVKRFVFASTIYVYSELGGFYRCSKQAGELYIEEYQKKYGLDFTILRYGSLYGPRASDGNGIHRYLTQGLQKGKIVYPGTGEEMREYIHVKDAAKLSVDILAEEYKNQHIVITGHHPMKSREMLEMIQEMVSQKISLEFSNPSNSFHYTLTPYSFTPKIGSKLVSNPYVDMGQGLLECLQEISKELDPSKVTD